MTHWICTSCGHYSNTPVPPAKCPTCGQPCRFNNVTCYRPECGGEDSLDPLLVATAMNGSQITHGGQLPTPDISAVQHKELVSGLTDEQEQRVLALGEVEIHGPGVTMFQVDHPARKIYTVEVGKVSINGVVGFQKQVPITIVSDGQVLGWSALVPPYLYTAAATTLERTTVTAIDRDKLIRLFEEEPSLGLVIIRNITRVIANRLKDRAAELTGFVYA